MNIKELSNLYYIKKEIERLEEELDEITEIGSSVIDGMPHNSNYNDKVQQLVIKKQDLMSKIIKKQIAYIDEKVKMENFINGIDNPKVRLIARLRFIEFKSWYEIADEITPKDKDLVDRTSPYNTFKRYFEKNNQMSHMSHR
jgi:hypothetical protein